MSKSKVTREPVGSKSEPIEQQDPVDGSPPGTAAGQRTTDPDPNDTAGTKQQNTLGKTIAADTESERVDTDCYRKLGEDADALLNAPSSRSKSN